MAHYKAPDNWKELGGIPDPEQHYPIKNEDGLHFWYQMMYHSQSARFEQIPEGEEVKFQYIVV